MGGCLDCDAKVSEGTQDVAKAMRILKLIGAYQAGVRLPDFGLSPKYFSELNSYL